MRRMSEQERQRLERQHWRWIKLIFQSALAGAAIGVIAAWLVLESNFNGLGDMVAHSPNRIGFTALLTLSFASTFGTIAMGVVIMVKSGFPGMEDG